MKVQYDTIAPQYESVKELPVVKYMETPTLLYILGELHGRTILDMACGTGYYSRIFASSGAQKVVGIDISEEMLQIARSIEEESPHQISYHQADASVLNVMGRFDLITGIFLFNYATSPENLYGMCENIYNNLDAGGTFLGVAMHPDYDITQKSSGQYGFEVLEQTPIKGGYEVEVELRITPPVRVKNYQWSAQVCEEALEKAGFDRISWRPYFVCSDGIEKYGWEFWGPFLRNPPLTFLLCYK